MLIIFLCKKITFCLLSLLPSLSVLNLQKNSKKTPRLIKTNQAQKNCLKSYGVRFQWEKLLALYTSFSQPPPMQSKLIKLQSAAIDR